MPTNNLTNNPMVNALLTAAIIGLVGWTLISVNELSKSVASLQVEIRLQSNLNNVMIHDLARRVDNVEKRKDL